MNMNDIREGMEVRVPDDPDPGIVKRLDWEDRMVYVDCKVRGEYGHPNGIIDIDPGDLEPWV